MPLSGLLSEYGFAGGWPSIFYVFGAVGTIWCIAFLIMVHEDPESHPRISEDEKKYILSALWGNAGASVNIPLDILSLDIILYSLYLLNDISVMPIYYYFSFSFIFLLYSLHLYPGNRSLLHCPSGLF